MRERAWAAADLRREQELQRARRPRLSLLARLLRRR
jgi:hypothetical protein